jgi:uncharacterized protein (TIGR02588 family)
VSSVAEAKKKRAPPLLEWAAGILGAVLFAAMLTVIVWNGVSNGQAAPSIDVRIERIEAGPHGYAVSFAARNDGDATAAEVRLVATLQLESGATEEREATFDYLPPHSTRRGGFLFSADPRGRPLEIEAQGYADP